MHIDFDAFLSSLAIMGKGMLGIFIVTLIIIAGIYILNAISKKAEEKKDAAEAEKTEEQK